MEDLLASLNKLSVSLNFDDPQKNYDDMIETIQFIESKQPITTDWVDMQFERIQKFREVFPNLDEINPDVENEEFREKAKESELIMITLINDIEYNELNVENYLLMLRNFDWMVIYLLDHHNEYMQ